MWKPSWHCAAAWPRLSKLNGGVEAVAATESGQSGAARLRMGIARRSRRALSVEMLKNDVGDEIVAAVAADGIAAVAEVAGAVVAAAEALSRRRGGDDGELSCARLWTRERARATELCYRRRLQHASVPWFGRVHVARRLMTWSCEVAAAGVRATFASFERIVAPVSAVFDVRTFVVFAVTAVWVVVAASGRIPCRFRCRFHCRSRCPSCCAQAAAALIGRRFCPRWLPDPWLLLRPPARLSVTKRALSVVSRFGFVFFVE